MRKLSSGKLQCFHFTWLEMSSSVGLKSPRGTPELHFKLYLEKCGFCLASPMRSFPLVELRMHRLSWTNWVSYTAFKTVISIQSLLMLGFRYSNVHFYRIGTIVRSDHPQNRITEMTSHPSNFTHWPTWITADSESNLSLHYVSEFSSIGFKIGEYLYDMLRREKGQQVPVAII